MKQLFFALLFVCGPLLVFSQDHGGKDRLAPREKQQGVRHNVGDPCRRNAAGLHIVLNAKSYEADGMTDRNGTAVFPGVPEGDVLVITMGKEKEPPSCPFTLSYSDGKTITQLWIGVYEELTKGVDLSLKKKGKITLSRKKPGKK